MTSSPLTDPYVFFEDAPLGYCGPMYAHAIIDMKLHGTFTVRKLAYFDADDEVERSIVNYDQVFFRAQYTGGRNFERKHLEGNESMCGEWERYHFVRLLV